MFDIFIENKREVLEMLYNEFSLKDRFTFMEFCHFVYVNSSLKK